MKSTVISAVLWGAVAVLLGLNLISGFAHDEVYYRTLSPQEFNRVTGNGVVPGYWIVMPFVTLFVIVPLWLLGSGLTLLAVRASGRSPRRGVASLVSPLSTSIVLGELAAISGVVQVYMALRR